MPKMTLLHPFTDRMTASEPAAMNLWDLLTEEERRGTFVRLWRAIQEARTDRTLEPLGEFAADTLAAVHLETASPGCRQELRDALADSDRRRETAARDCTDK
jgi:hypothetical protein